MRKKLAAIQIGNRIRDNMNFFLINQNVVKLQIMLKKAKKKREDDFLNLNQDKEPSNTEV